MDKNKANKALIDIQQELGGLYGEIKWILASKRGRNFQFMMLERTFGAYMSSISRLMKNYTENSQELKNTQELFPDLLEFK